MQLLNNIKKCLNLTMLHFDLKMMHCLKLQKKQLNGKQVHVDLRSIIENIMLDVMYELPSLEEVTECIITKESVLGEANPILLREDGLEFDLDNEKNSA